VTLVPGTLASDSGALGRGPGIASHDPGLISRDRGVISHHPNVISRDPGVLVLGGPTGTGKSELAAALASAIGGAVVSADSRQVYRGLEIGTAQPDAHQRARAPHFLVGFLSPAAEYSAGRYGDDARRTVASLRARGIPVVLCGGTGLYLRSALGGLFRELEPGPSSRDAAAGIRAGPIGEGAYRRGRRAALVRRWGREGADALHAELALVDPALASRLHPGDRQRVLRGLSFHAESGRPLSRAWSGDAVAGASMQECVPGASRETPPIGEPGAGALRFRLELPIRELEQRIRARLEGMLRAGLVGEARALQERYGDDPPASLNAVGYPELFRHFRGGVSLDEALGRILLRTRQYAKRQRTWFRHQDDYRGLPAGEGALDLLRHAWLERLPDLAPR
jgi:tRNA dimethylallyltransferase